MLVKPGLAKMFKMLGTAAPCSREKSLYTLKIRPNGGLPCLAHNEHEALVVGFPSYEMLVLRKKVHLK